MTIYVDTNAIPPHGPLDSIDLSALRAVVMEHGFDVALPRMVVEESIGQRRRHVRAAIERVRSAQHAVREFWKVESPPSPDLDDTVEQWRTHLEGRFRVVETPANAANEALAREIHRIPPTRDGKGARDAVIWLSIIDDIKGTDGESNFLITSNKKDFASPQDPNSFHPALLEELGARALTLKRTVADVIDVLAKKVDFDLTPEVLAKWPGAEDAVSSEFARIGFHRLVAERRDELEAVVGVAAVGDLYLSRAVRSRPSMVSRVTAYEVEGRQVAIAVTDWEVDLEIGALRKYKGGGLASQTFLVRATVQAHLWLRLGDNESSEAEVAALASAGPLSPI